MLDVFSSVDSGEIFSDQDHPLISSRDIPDVSPFEGNDVIPMIPILDPIVQCFCSIEINIIASVTGDVTVHGVNYDHHLNFGDAGDQDLIEMVKSFLSAHGAAVPSL